MASQYEPFICEICKGDPEKHGLVCPFIYCTKGGGNVSEKPEVQQIPIDPNGRYFILVKGLPSEAFVPIAEQIKAWWQSGDPVFLASIGPDVEVEFLRMDDDEQKPSQG